MSKGIVLFKRFKSITLSIILLVCACLNIFASFCLSTYTPAVACNAGADKVAMLEFPSIKDIIKDIFTPNKKVNKDNRVIKVFAGGYPLGFTMECEGVIVVAVGEVLTADGVINPLADKNIKAGDILYKIDEQIITSATHLQSILNSANLDAESGVELEIRRGGQVIKENVKPAFELSTSSYRLGLWIRDNTAGVGTLTYVRADNNRFGALGHPVCDIDTGRAMPITTGNIYKCSIVGYNKGQRGNPGELRGLFLKTGQSVGNLNVNNDFGVYGTMNQEFLQTINARPMEVGFKDTVKTGKAKILTTIDGDTPKEYDIEIVKLNHQTKSDKKSMVLRVTDKELISKTGGIVQGMSGSPIIQNGKLVGAVTHVFVSDPTKGFGVYIDWMIDN